MLEAEYRRRGITVTEDEIVEAMRTSPPPDFQKIPEFQTDSQFDLGKYQRWLTSSVAQQYLPSLEAQYRDQLERSKLLRVVTADIYLSDAALWEQYRDEHEKVKIGLTAIVARNVVPDSAVSLSDAEINAYYKAHLDDFKRPAHRLPELRGPAPAHHRRRHRRRAGARRFGPRGDRGRRAVRRGGPARVVRQRERGAGRRSGRVDPRHDGRRPSIRPPSRSRSTRVSQPVLSQFGFHLIEVTSRKGDKAKGRHILIPIEVAGAHRDQLDAQADTLEKLAAEKADPAALDTVARALKLPIGKSGPVQEGTKVQLGTLVVPDAGVWAFDGQAGSRRAGHREPRSPSTSSGSTACSRPACRRSSRSGDAVAYPARDREEARARPRSWPTNIMKRARGGRHAWPAVADSMKLPVQGIRPVQPGQPAADDPVVVGTAFGLDVGQRSGMLDTKDGIYFMKSLEHTKADSAAFMKELDNFRAQMIARRGRTGSGATWRRSARTAKVVDDRKKVLQQTGPEPQGA